MHAGYPERRVIPQHLGSDERQVEIAGARSVASERGAVDESRACNRASAKDGRVRFGHCTLNETAKLVVHRSVVVEGEFQYAAQLRGVIQRSGHGGVWPASRSLRMTRSSIQCGSHHSVAFTNCPFPSMLKCR